MLLPIFELEMKEKYFFPTIKPKNREIFWKYKENKEKIQSWICDWHHEQDI